jgi:hypothetical protein
VFERAKSVHALDRAATVIGQLLNYHIEELKTEGLLIVIKFAEHCDSLIDPTVLRNTFQVPLIEFVAGRTGSMPA